MSLSSLTLHTGCVTYRQVESGDLSGLDEIRITMVFGKQEHLSQPRQVEYAVAGLGPDAGTPRIPAAGIKNIEVRENGAKKTLGWLVAGAASRPASRSLPWESTAA